jgi:CRP-like cAMP-binding protein
MPNPTHEQNKILAALPADERARLAPHLQCVTFERGQSLYRAGDSLTDLYFPITLVAALMALGRSGASTALALIGREGGIGLAEALAGERLPHDIVALMPGVAYRLPVDGVPGLFAAHHALLPVALNYGHSLTTQIAHTAFCNLHHPLEQRLCRWLLSIAYRQSGQTLQLTEEQIASVLGVRRESVSQATVRLQEEGLIRHHRGLVEISDRDSLEAKACECLPVFPWHAYPLKCPITPPAVHCPPAGGNL